ncbi:unnamed protein product [Blepharisma stoltei]|uniref:Nudix hydrolase domain-containing protein n=1 Tax=Blepharisma stoltei TaxID=1481888 RepID=A0AAU9JRY3_9CILI|nr:unnamed protein product [Blepharisma stoltei]
MEIPTTIDEKCLYEGKYMHFHEKTVEKADGSRITWEIVCRPPHGSVKQGVDIIPKILKNDEWFYILTLEYRYPVEGYVLSFPGGTSNDNEQIELGALRELKEETGFSASLGDIAEDFARPQVWIDPWKSTEKTMYVEVTVNGDLEENKDPQQELDLCEIIDVVFAKTDQLLEEIKKIQEERQCMVDSRLYSFALGLSLNI